MMIDSLRAQKRYRFEAALPAIALIAIGLLPITGTAAQSLSSRNQSVMGASPQPLVPPPSATPNQGLTPDALAALNRQISLQARNQLAIDAMRAAQDRARNLAIQSNAPLRPGLAAVPNGLVTGGLDPNVVEADVLAGRSRTDTAATQLKVWQGAKFPTTGVKADGSAGTANDVNVDITADRAILSWASFNVGKETTLTFKPAAQFEDAGNKGWVALNRIVGGLNPDGTRNGAGPAPSQILGKVQVTDAKGNASKGTGTLLVLNQNGIIFGGSSQINVSTLIASTADVGYAADTIFKQASDYTIPRFLAARNSDFLQYGLFGLREKIANDKAGNTINKFPSFSEFSPYVSSDTALADTAESKPATGIFVDAGARMSTAGGGAIILNSLNVQNAGSIDAENGNVSLVASLGMSLSANTGTDAGPNPFIRGLIGVPRIPYNKSSYLPSQLRSINTGIIDAPGGAIIVSENGIGTLTGDDGRPKNFGGILRSSTSVSRNGFIAVERSMGSYNPQTGLRTDAANASLIEILPDSAQTIPQDPTSLSNFKPSQVRIGSYLGENALVYAPGAVVAFGEDSLVLNDSDVRNRLVSLSQLFLPSDRGGVLPAIPSGVAGAAPYYGYAIERGAEINVAGVKDVLVPASRNAIKIGPLKGNELANSPQYRTGFLNGATVYVDPRLSGVRSDGVAWIGSPLIDAASYVQQVGISAREIATKGGSVTIDGVKPVGNDNTLSASYNVGAGVTVDISGGWKRFEAGQITTTQLRGADGRTYDIGEADPLKTRFTGFAGGFTVDHTKWGLTETFASPLGGNTSLRFVDGYIEGRDAGTLSVGGGAPVGFAGRIVGDAYAGLQQIVKSQTGTAAKTGWDQRLQQTAPSQLPAAGGLRIDYGFANSRQTAAGVRRFDIVFGETASYSATRAGDGQIGWSVPTLNDAGLSQISVNNDRRFTLNETSTVTLKPGGVFDVTAGRAIAIRGAVTAPGGTIALETAPTPTFNQTLDNTGQFIVSRLTPFDIKPGDFDITVDGRLSVAGRFVNDFGANGDSLLGSAFLDAGKISLVGAARVAVPKTIIPGLDDGVGKVGDYVVDTVDVSGSIFINKSRLPGNLATLDLNSGARIGTDAKLTANAKGGSLSLISKTAYFKVGNPNSPSSNVILDYNLASQRIRNDPTRTAVEEFYPLPDQINAKVLIDPTARIDSFGFGGGGKFELVTPGFEFVGRDAYERNVLPADFAGTRLPKDFIERNGFQDYTITSFKTLVLPNNFYYDGPSLGNSRGERGLYEAKGYNAFLATQQVTIGAGETLRLRNKIFSTLTDPNAELALRSLASGSDILSVLTPASLAETPELEAKYGYYRSPVNLTFGGLMELKVAAGGRIAGEAGAKLGVVKLLNQGVIDLPGGSIEQFETLPNSQPLSTLPSGQIPRSVYDVLGDPSASGPFAGKYFEDGQSRIRDNDGRFVDAAGVPYLTNSQAVSDRYIPGELAADAGIVLAPGSVTNLKGVSLRDPLARAVVDGSVTSLQTGRILGGGKISLAQDQRPVTDVFKVPNIFSRVTAGANPYPLSAGTQPGRTLIADRATIDISGASDSFDLRNAALTIAESPYARSPVWSSAGSILAPNGATLNEVSLSARGGGTGGTAKAAGGVLDILNPILVAGNTPDMRQGVLSASFLERAGIDTLIARGGLSAEGIVNLTLGRSLNVVSRYASSAANRIGGINEYATILSGTAGSDLTVRAPYIRLQSSFDIALTTLGSGTSKISLIADGGAGSAGAFDIAGSVSFDRAFESRTDAIRLESTGDLRFQGTAGQFLAPGLDSVPVPTLRGGLFVPNAVTIKSQRTYATTGSNFVVSSSGAGGSVVFERSGLNEATPYSAGSSLSVFASSITQGGALFAPQGTLRLGTTANETIPDFGLGTKPTQTLTLTGGSLTSVSGGAISVPYGVTTDLKEWYFAPTVADPLSAPPSKVLALAGSDIRVQTQAKVDLKGGGDVFAYEFVPGTGGSRDVLNRENPDVFSGTLVNGTRYLYPDARQVYAIVPGFDSPAALYDPIYSASYGELSSASGAGRRVYLNGGAGVAPGWYTLLPAQYAILPGGIRVVERTGSTPAIGQQPGTLADGTRTVTGYFGQLGTEDYKLRVFDVQSQDIFRQYSRIQTTSGNTYFPAKAASSGATGTRQLADAAAVSIAALNSLSILSDFDAAHPNGRGAIADVTGGAIRVVSPGGTALPGEIALDAGSLNRLQAESLLLGGTRSFNTDGSTTLKPFSAASSIVIANDASNPLQAPELLLFAGGSVTLAPGAALTAVGQTADTTTADYVIKTALFDTGGRLLLDRNGNPTYFSGALLRVANGPQRLARDVPASGSISVGAGATVSGTSVLTAIGTGKTLTIDPTANLNVTDFALNAGEILFGENAASGFTGLLINNQLSATLSRASRLTISSDKRISFDALRDAGGNPIARKLGDARLFAPILAPVGNANIVLEASRLTLGNRGAVAPGCGTGSAPVCAGSLTINVTGSGTGAGAVPAEVVFEAGSVSTGFAGTVNITAAGGIFGQNGEGGFDTGAASLRVVTPSIADRRVAGSTQSRLQFKSAGSITIEKGANQAAPDVAAVAGYPGATIGFDAASVAISGTRVRATAGIVTAVARSGNVAITNGAMIETPGYDAILGRPDVDPVTKPAPGGRIHLEAQQGGLTIATGTTVSVGGGTSGKPAGTAGTLELIAPNVSAVDIAVDALNGFAKPENGGASLTVNTGGDFDLFGFAGAAASRGFTGAIDITARGNLTLDANQTLVAQSVKLTSNRGGVSIAGTIDTRGLSGGDVGLFGFTGVTLSDSGRILASAYGYGYDSRNGTWANTDTRSVRAGNVTFGTEGNGTIDVAANALIDVQALQTENRIGRGLPGGRLVEVPRQDKLYYQYVEADQGGTVRFRAPSQTLAGPADLNITAASGSRSQIRGAKDVVLEGFRRFDLDAIAAADVNETIKSVTISTDANGVRTASLDPRGRAFGYTAAPTETNPAGTVLAGGVADYIQRFDVSSRVANQFANLDARTALRKQPGVDLAFDGNILLSRNWNLAAGSVRIDRDARGIATRTDLFTTPFPSDSNPAFRRLFYLKSSASLQERQRVESVVFSDLTSMLYRTGKSVFGEAPALTIRASGSLTTKGSISDGFFSFREQTVDFGRTAPGGRINAFYSANANLPSPNDWGNTDASEFRAGDPFGSMVLFPTLPGGIAAKSSSIALTAGAALKGSGATLIASPNADGVAANPGAALTIGGSYVYDAGVGGRTTQILATAVSPSVRTGLGNVALSSSGGIDLRGSETPIQLYSAGLSTRTIRLEICADFPECADFNDATELPTGATFVVNASRTGGEVQAGARVYTAGVRAVTPASAVAERRNSDGSLSRTAFTLDAAPYIPLRDYRPVATFPLDYAVAGYRGPGLDPVFLTGAGQVAVSAGGPVLDRVQTGTFELPRSQEKRNPDANFLNSPVIALSTQRLTSGVGSFGGGAVSVKSGGSITELTTFAESSELTADATRPGDTAPATRVLLGFGGGNATVGAAGSIFGGGLTVRSGQGRLSSGADITKSVFVRGLTDPETGRVTDSIFTNQFEVTAWDATMALSAGRDLFTGRGLPNLISVTSGGNFIARELAASEGASRSSLSVLANRDVGLNRKPRFKSGILGGVDELIAAVYPASLSVAALLGDLSLGDTEPGTPAQRIFLAPGTTGDLQLFAGGSIAPANINMSDTLEDNFPSIFTNVPILQSAFDFPDNSPLASPAALRSQHRPRSNAFLAGGPIRINAGTDIRDLLLNVTKETRIEAGRDIVNMAFFGQNLERSDVTRIAAGRDITATSAVIPTGDTPAILRPSLQGNTFYIGGPGNFILEAGRDMGPFLNSATIAKRDYGGGVLAVGNALNPYLPAESASVSVRFGVGKGVAWIAFQDAYLKPANVAALPAEYFTGGRKGVERDYIYAARLIAWVKANAGDAFIAAASSGKSEYEQAYAAFASLPLLRRQAFLQEVYYAELAATSDTSYARGYQAVNTLFPADMSADGQYGYTRNALSGGSNGANELVHTGDLDLRLATIQTQFGGDVNILGPGGRLLGGSVVRTSDQIARRSFDGLRLFSLNAFAKAYTGFERSYAFKPRVIEGIPTDLEGILTIRSGNINSFTDTDVLLNASRIATRSSGDIFLWSSNADLNAGEGPKTSANYPPVVVACTYNGYCPQNPGGAITGAGIATYPPDDADLRPGDVTLRAGRGTIDAGAAGVRVAGNLSIAALRVLNADNFQVKGTSTGLPAVSTPNLGALENAGNVTGAAVKEAASETRKGNDRPSIIIVEIVGFGGSDGNDSDDCTPEKRDRKQCPAQLPAPASPQRGAELQMPKPNSPVQIIGNGRLGERELAQLDAEERRNLAQ